MDGLQPPTAPTLGAYASRRRSLLRPFTATPPTLNGLVLPASPTKEEALSSYPGTTTTDQPEQPWVSTDYKIRK